MPASSLPLAPRPGGFSWFLVGVTLSGLGMWMLRLIQTLIALDVSGGSATVVGVTVMLQFAPAVLLSAAIGVWADRIGPVRLLLLGQAAMASAALAEGLLAAVGQLDLTWSIAFATLFGIGSAIDNPLRLTVVPLLVPATRVARGVSLNMFANQVTRLAGPALAAILTATSNNQIALMTAGAVMAAFIPILGWISVHHKPTRSRARETGLARQGFAYVRARQDFIVIFVSVAVGGLMGTSLVTAITLLAVNELGLGNAAVGIANFALAVGTVSGVVVSAWIVPRSARQIAWICVSVGLTGAAIALAGNLAWFCVLLVPAGLTTLLMATLSSAYIQVTVADAFRSRVTALFAVVLIIAAPIMSPLIGAMSDLLGTRPAVGMTGMGVAIVCGVIALRAPSRHTAIELSTTGTQVRTD